MKESNEVSLIDMIILGCISSESNYDKESIENNLLILKNLFNDLNDEYNIEDHLKRISQGISILERDLEELN